VIEQKVLSAKIRLISIQAETFYSDLSLMLQTNPKTFEMLQQKQILILLKAFTKTSYANLTIKIKAALSELTKN